MSRPDGSISADQALFLMAVVDLLMINYSRRVLRNWSKTGALHLVDGGAAEVKPKRRPRRTATTEAAGTAGGVPRPDRRGRPVLRATGRGRHRFGDPRRQAAPGNANLTLAE